MGGMWSQLLGNLNDFHSGRSMSRITEYILFLELYCYMKYVRFGLLELGSWKKMELSGILEL